MTTIYYKSWEEEPDKSAQLIASETPSGYQIIALNKLELSGPGLVLQGTEPNGNRRYFASEPAYQTLNEKYNIAFQKKIS